MGLGSTTVISQSLPGLRTINSFRNVVQSSKVRGCGVGIYGAAVQRYVQRSKRSLELVVCLVGTHVPLIDVSNFQ